MMAELAFRMFFVERTHVVRHLLPIVALLLLSSAARGGEALADATGIGIQSCAIFAKAYRADPEAAEALYSSWGSGYLTGLNVMALANKTKRRNLAGIPFEERKKWMRDWCSGNPLKDYAEGVVAFFLTLPALPDQP
jgi:hypothetical protein